MLPSKNAREPAGQLLGRNLISKLPQQLACHWHIGLAERTYEQGHGGPTSTGADSGKRAHTLPTSRTASCTRLASASQKALNSAWSR
jgi:hypothetical protein